MQPDPMVKKRARCLNGPHADCRCSLQTVKSDSPASAALACRHDRVPEAHTDAWGLTGGLLALNSLAGLNGRRRV